APVGGLWLSVSARPGSEPTGGLAVHAPRRPARSGTVIPFSLTRAQVRELDRRAIHEYGVPGVVLMENAGRGAAELLVRLNPERQRVLILCGPGNNGGDGFVMARHLQNH